MIRNTIKSITVGNTQAGWETIQESTQGSGEVIPRD
jgi:hypothetical protein